jgi:HSP20 family protein
MSLIKRAPQTLSSFFNDWMADDFFSASWLPQKLRNEFPPVNVSETDEAYSVEIATPGMKKENIDVKIDGKLLTISGKEEKENEEKKRNYMRKEFSSTSFTRSFQLPEDVNEEAIEALHEDGLLKLMLPKVQTTETKNLRQITVS